MESILQTTLATVIQQLADFFGITTEVIMQNAPMWLAKYGWFTLMQNFPCIVSLWLALSAIAVAVEIFILCDDCSDKTITKIITITIILSAIIVFGIGVAQCAIAPELYGLKALLEIIK